MVTKYKKLYEILKDQINILLESGNDLLPSEREIALSQGVSRQTVRQALSLLEKDNLIIRIQGGGSHLTGIRPDSIDNHIAMILSDSSSYIFPHIVSSFRSLLETAGYTLDIYETNGRYEAERKALTEILSGRYLAVVSEPVCCGRPTPNADLYEMIMANKKPVFFLFGYYPNVRNSLYIKDDNIAGGRRLCDYLLSLSHRKIAGLFLSDSLTGYERFFGFSRALIEAGLPLPDENILWFSNEQMDNLEKKQDTRFLDDFIKSKLAPCSAIVCYNDVIAYWLIRELNFAGINVPQDVSIVSFDNSYLSDMSKVRISGMSHKEDQISETLFSLLRDRLIGRDANPVTLPWSFVDKGSCTDLT